MTTVLKQLSCLLLCCGSLAANAQDAALPHISKMEQHRSPAAVAKTTIADPEENNYDVQYLKLDLEMDNVSTNVKGSATTAFKVLVGGFNKYVFELNPVLTIDSIKMSNQLMSVTTNGVIRTVNLPASWPAGTILTATVYYHGQSPVGTTFFTHGLILGQVGSNQIMYSVSDMYLASDWWPSKQAITDKIETADIWITVPNDMKAGSNGRLMQVTPLSSTRNRYEWKTNYPIEYYLVSVAVAPYKEYNYYIHYTGSSDSTFMQNYILDSASFMPAYKLNIDTVGLTVDYFSQLFGRYPFWQEKYGQCFSNLGGGMEHQTMSTVGFTQTQLLGHELCHQWWGDHVTYKTWRDIWLSEGFASYGEQLYTEHFWGTQAAYNYREPVYNRVMQALGGSVYVDDTTNPGRVFDSRLTYDKGAAVAHMLRFVAPNDSTYFAALRNYQQQYAFGVATTEDFKQSVAATYGGANLDTFFQQWVYGQGYPTYKGTWNQAGNTVAIHLDQTVSRPLVTPLFCTPLEIKLQSATGDTVVKVYNNAASQTYLLSWSKTMTGMSIDPDNWILNKVSTITQDNNMSVPVVYSGSIAVHPNPAKSNWHISGLEPNTSLSLSDLSGRTVWQGRASSATEISNNELVPGMYLLQVRNGNGDVVATLKLVKM